VSQQTVDPGAASVMSLANDLMIARDQVQKLRKTVWGLMAVIHSERAVNRALTDLLDELLTAEPGDG
jgi:hypothetical protein